jgi:hypothetical protein
MSIVVISAGVLIGVLAAWWPDLVAWWRSPTFYDELRDEMLRQVLRQEYALVEATIVVTEDGRLLALDLPDEVLADLESLVGPMDGRLFGPLGLCG